MEGKLTGNRVEAIFLNCLFKEEEDKSNHVKAEGIMNTVGFHPGRLETYKEEIAELLQELPDEFQKSKGGGWSFLNACMDRHGNQWAGVHQTVEQLLLLGIATGKVSFQLPREIWNVLPGGMPYLVVNDI